MTVLARTYGVSRKTAYRCVRRVEAGEGVTDQSRRPQTSPRRTAPELETAVRAAKARYPSWGGRVEDVTIDTDPVEEGGGICQPHGHIVVFSDRVMIAQAGFLEDAVRVTQMVLLHIRQDQSDAVRFEIVGNPAVVGMVVRAEQVANILDRDVEVAQRGEGLGNRAGPVGVDQQPGARAWHTVIVRHMWVDADGHCEHLFGWSALAAIVVRGMWRPGRSELPERPRQ